MFHLIQYAQGETGAAGIASKVELAIADGRLAPGERLPTVRELAAGLAISPATAAAAYRTLQQRGLISTGGRRGTVVAPQPPLRLRGARPLPAGTRDLASGNPDPALLPPLAPALAGLDPEHKLYGGPAVLPRLAGLAAADFAADQVAGEVTITGAALDGIERVLHTQLRPGDRVAVEDPCWPRIPDLIRAAGFQPEPVALDQSGPLPDGLSRALGLGAKAVIVTPRGQNPSAGAVSAARAAELTTVLGEHPGVLVVEDDYLAAVAGAPYHPLHGASPRWAVIRSMSKVLGPDLRIATMAGDALTISRVEGRQLLGPGWVSHLLQQTAAQLWAGPGTPELLARAGRTYAQRRSALVGALASYGIAAHGGSGLGVWVPLTEEAATVQQLLERGWAVSPGERFRFRTPPGIRITATTLLPDEAGRLAADLDAIVHATPATYTG
jgi:DNA-binding transcriptional MocR family regulator